MLALMRRASSRVSSLAASDAGLSRPASRSSLRVHGTDQGSRPRRASLVPSTSRDAILRSGVGDNHSFDFDGDEKAPSDAGAKFAVPLRAMAKVNLARFCRGFFPSIGGDGGGDIFAFWRVRWGRLHGEPDSYRSKGRSQSRVPRWPHRN
jgi:hypothetical protein